MTSLFGSSAILGTLLLAGCASPATRQITQGTAVGHRVWFAEIEGRASKSDIIAYVVCSATASPPCIRFAARDVKTEGDVTKWLQTDPGPAPKHGPMPPGAPGFPLRRPPPFGPQPPRFNEPPPSPPVTEYSGPRP